MPTALDLGPGTAVHDDDISDFQTFAKLQSPHLLITSPGYYRFVRFGILS